MPYVTIAAELCKGCELCIAFCPKDCLEHAPELNRYGVYPIRLREGSECIGCSQCAIMCPDTAIEVFRSAAEKSEKPEAAL